MLKGSSFSLLFLLLVFIPFFLGSFVIEPTGLPRFLVVSFIALLLLVWQLGKREALIPDGIIFVPLVLIVALSYCSIFWATNEGEAIHDSNKFLLQLVLTIGFLNLLNTERDRTRVYISLCLAVLALSVFSFFEIIVGGEDPSLAFHGNLLSSFLFLALIPAGLLFIEGKNFSRALSILTMVVALLMIFFLQSRAVWIASLFGVLAFVLLWWIRNKKRSTRLLVASVFVVFYLGGTIVGHWMVWKKHELVNESTSSLKERQLLWEKSVYLIAESPIQGVGAGNWQFEYSKFGVGDVEKTRFYNILFKRPHNDFLWVTTEIGIAGLVLTLLIISVLGWKSLKLFLLNGNLKLLVILSGLIGFLFISFHSFPKERLLHIVLTSIVVAVLLNELKMTVTAKKAMSRSYILIGTVTVLFTLLAGSYRFKGEYYTYQLLQAKDEGKATGMIKAGEKALSFFYNVDPTMTPIQSYLGEAHLLLGEKEEMLFTSRKAFETAPYHYKTVTNYGYALMLNFQLHQAKKILLESHAINPYYEPTLLNLSVISYNQGNYQEAMDWLSKIVGYQIKYPTNYQRISEQLSVRRD